MGTVYISPDKVWAYFVSHKTELKCGEKLIADNPEYGIEIFIAGFLPSFCTILVTADDTPVYEEDADNEMDCESIIRMLYDNYLSPGAISILDDFDGISDDETCTKELTEKEVEAEEIEVREGELDDAVLTFLETTLDMPIPYGEKTETLIADLKEHFLEYMWRKHSLPIYRPMYLVDENNEQFFEEYPYECMVFDE